MLSCFCLNYLISSLLQPPLNYSCLRALLEALRSCYLPRDVQLKKILNCNLKQENSLEVGLLGSCISMVGDAHPSKSSIAHSVVGDKRRRTHFTDSLGRVSDVREKSG